MQVFGREITFRRDWGANIKIAKLCPGHDLSRMQELFADNDFVVMADTNVQLLTILSESSERHKAYMAAQDGQTYKPQPLTEDEIMMLTDDEITELLNDAMAAMQADSKTQIETKPVKKEEPGENPGR